SPVSSTLITSAPKSASSIEQNPPGSSRVRSRTRRPSSGNVMSSDPEQRPRLLDRRGAPAKLLGEPTGRGYQFAVRPRHRPIGQVEVVLEPDPDRAAER